jgi:hypothetical protein
MSHTCNTSSSNSSSTGPSHTSLSTAAHERMSHTCNTTSSSSSTGASHTSQSNAAHTHMVWPTTATYGLTYNRNIWSGTQPQHMVWHTTATVAHRCCSTRSRARHCCTTLLERVVQHPSRLASIYQPTSVLPAPLADLTRSSSTPLVWQLQTSAAAYLSAACALVSIGMAVRMDCRTTNTSTKIPRAAAYLSAACALVSMGMAVRMDCTLARNGGSATSTTAAGAWRLLPVGWQPDVKVMSPAWL